MKKIRTSRAPIALLTIAALLLACVDGMAPTPSPLAGLDRVSTTDTGTTPPPPPPPVGVGSFHGVVRGYTKGAIDTLNTAVLLVGARVTAYPRTTATTDTLGLGPMAASVLTDASGVFHLPVLAAGPYIVTFNPPAGSKYGGGWTIATASATSNQSPWWIMLQSK